MTVNNDAEPFGFGNWNEYNVNILTSNDWRASLVPAAAVIPAPIAYIKVVAVKTLVVEFVVRGVCGVSCVFCVPILSVAEFSARTRVTVKKLECLKQAIA